MSFTLRRVKDIILLFAGAVVGWLLTALLYPLARPTVVLSRRLWRIRPLDAYVERDPEIIWAGCPPWVAANFWFPTLPPSDPPDDCRSWWEWARRYNGRDAQQTTLKITVQARQDASLIIEGVRLRHAHTQPVPENGIVAVCPVGGASLSPRRIEINLDWNGVGSMSWLEGDEYLTGPPVLTLAPGEIEQFHVWAKSTNGYHEWELELLMLLNGRRLTQVINDNGKPFVTVGTAGQLMTMRSGDSWSEPTRLTE